MEYRVNQIYHYENGNDKSDGKVHMGFLCHTIHPSPGEWK
jgi:hypothetical protein